MSRAHRLSKDTEGGSTVSVATASGAIRTQSEEDKVHSHLSILIGDCHPSSSIVPPIAYDYEEKTTLAAGWHIGTFVCSRLEPH